jgi:hypothetical protein
MSNMPSGESRNIMLAFKKLHASIEYVYDPDQDPEEKRSVRRNYRNLARTVEGTNEAILLLNVILT